MNDLGEPISLPKPPGVQPEIGSGLAPLGERLPAPTPIEKLPSALDQPIESLPLDLKDARRTLFDPTDQSDPTEAVKALARGLKERAGLNQDQQQLVNEVETGVEGGTITAPDIREALKAELDRKLPESDNLTSEQIERRTQASQLLKKLQEEIQKPENSRDMAALKESLSGITRVAATVGVLLAAAIGLIVMKSVKSVAAANQQAA